MNPRILSLSTAGLLSLMLFWAVGSIPAVPGRAPEEGTEADAAKEKQPEFKNAAAAKEFGEGAELFEKGDYRGAQAKFKRVKSRAKAAEDKKIIESWEAACLGGLHVELFRRQAEASPAPEKIFFQAQDLFERYAGTQIDKVYTAFLEELAGKAIHPLEDFEHPSSQYSEKYGKYFEEDPAKVFHGRGCLRWEQTPDRTGFQLQIDRVPKDWSNYSGLVLWVYFEQKVEMELVVRCPGKTKEQVNSLMVKHTPVSSGRWERIHYEFDKFQKYGQGSITAVDRFLVQIPGKRDFKLRVDWIGLVRKPASTAAKKK